MATLDEIEAAMGTTGDDSKKGPPFARFTALKKRDATPIVFVELREPKEFKGMKGPSLKVPADIVNLKDGQLQTWLISKPAFIEYRREVGGDHSKIYGVWKEIVGDRQNFRIFVIGDITPKAQSVIDAALAAPTTTTEEASDEIPF